MSNYILRREGVGPETCPKIAQYAIEMGTPLTVIDGTHQALPSDAEIVFRWGTIKTVQNGPKMVNKSKAISAVSDKRGYRLVLSSLGLAPISFGSVDELLQKSTQWPVQKLLVRPAVHKRSEGMFLCATPCELMKAVADISGPYYISEFVNKQKEYRVFVAQNRVVWMIEKHPKSADEVSWGCVEDGKFDYVNWGDFPKNVVKVALEAMKPSGLDFGAVDIIVDEEGRALVTEINTAPWLSPYYMKCIAKVFSGIVRNGRDHFPDPIDLNWKNVIHPAIGG